MWTKLKEKIDLFIKKIRENESAGQATKFLSENKIEAIIYILLVIGLILSLYRPFWGQLIIGIVAGIYFGDELIAKSRLLDTQIEKQGIFRVIIFCFLLLAILLAAPGIFIGALLAMGFKLLLSATR